jgi:hypothetical protein
MIAWDYQADAAAYNPAENRWRTLPRVPMDPSEGYPRSVSLGNRVFGEFNGTMVVHRAAPDRWHQVPRPVRIDSWLDIAPASPAVLVFGRAVSGDSTAMLAYRPAS